MSDWRLILSAVTTPIHEPREGTIYEGPAGPMLYVRTEEGEVVLVGTGNRAVYTRRFPADAMPPELALVHDPNVRALLDEEVKRANQLVFENAALLAAMKRAVALLPIEAGNDLRAAYAKALKGE